MKSDVRQRRQELFYERLASSLLHRVSEPVKDAAEFRKIIEQVSPLLRLGVNGKPSGAFSDDLFHWHVHLRLRAAAED